MYIFLEICDLNDKNKQECVQHGFKIYFTKAPNVDWMHSIWYVRYTFIGFHKITVSLKASDYFKIDSKVTVS